MERESSSQVGRELVVCDVSDLVILCDERKGVDPVD